MKSTKLLLGLLLAAIMVFGSVAATAAPQEQAPKITANDHIVLTETVKKNDPADEGDEIGLFDVQLITPLRYKAKAAYENSFTTDPNNGKFMNIHVKNNGSGTVYLTITRNGQDFPGNVAIAAGTQKTSSYEEQVSTGLSGDWKVYIYTKDGSEMDLNISARQF